MNNFSFHTNHKNTFTQSSIIYYREKNSRKTNISLTYTHLSEFR